MCAVYVITVEGGAGNVTPMLSVAHIIRKVAMIPRLFWAVKQASGQHRLG